MIFLVITEIRPLQKNAQTFFMKLKPDKKVTIILQKSFQIKANNGDKKLVSFNVLLIHSNKNSLSSGKK